MSVCRSQDGALLNATSFAAESVCCWNFSTQIGASAATTAVSARWLAILRGAAECPSKRRKPDNRERNSADHCTPYRWFHPGMNLHCVTSALAVVLLVQITRGNVARSD